MAEGALLNLLARALLSLDSCTLSIAAYAPLVSTLTMHEGHEDRILVMKRRLVSGG